MAGTGVGGRREIEVGGGVGGLDDVQLELKTKCVRPFFVPFCSVIAILKQAIGRNPKSFNF